MHRPRDSESCGSFGSSVREIELRTRINQSISHAIKTCILSYIDEWRQVTKVGEQNHDDLVSEVGNAVVTKCNNDD